MRVKRLLDKLMILAYTAVLLMVGSLYSKTLSGSTYMDEIFHVPQAQKYCQGDWVSWDEKITTFPGVYIVSAILFRIYSVIISPENLNSLQCTAHFLRATNILLGIACVPIFHGILKQVWPWKSERNLVLMTAVCATFPLHFFFVFLYYTDTASTFFCLACFLRVIRQEYTWAGIYSMCAIGMRQTNVVWVGFFCGWAVVDMSGNRPIQREKRDIRYTTEGTLIQQIKNVVSFTCMQPHIWIPTLWLFLLGIAAFVVFVLQNGGIVVGDKQHHVPVKHWMQPLYFHGFIEIMALPIVVRKSVSAVAGWFTSPMKAAGALCLCGAFAVLVRHGTLIHPFILADNRHYTFYIWRRVLNRTTWSRYAAIPMYAIASWNVWGDSLEANPLISVGLAGCTAAVLIPAHLIEFRYYTIPFFIYMMVFFIGRASTKQLLATLCMYMLVNVITIYLFLYRPFQWPDGSTARFMY